mgnify:CR=1 FL=1
MDRDVMLASFWIGGVAPAQRKVRASIFRGISWRGQDFQDIKVRIGRQVDNFLTYVLVAWKNNQLNRIGDVI